MQKCACGKTIKKQGEVFCSACRKKYNLGSNITPKTRTYSPSARTCICGKKIRDVTQFLCSTCRKKRGY